MEGPSVVRKLVLLLIVASGAFGASGAAVAGPDPKAPDVKSPNAGKRVSLERVVAVVNDAIVLQSELDARLVPVQQDAQQISDPAERKRRLAKLASQVLD